MGVRLAPPLVEGALRAHQAAALAPEGERRMGANPHANGDVRVRDRRMPSYRAHAVDVPLPGAADAEHTLVLGEILRDVTRLNEDQRSFRIFDADVALSNMLGAVFKVTSRQWDAETEGNDDFLAPDGRVLDSMLGEHPREGYLLVGIVSRDDVIAVPDRLSYPQS